MRVKGDRERVKGDTERVKGDRESESEGGQRE